VFHAALEAELADGLTTLGRLGDGVFVGPVPMAVGIDADLVIVLGLIEGTLPGGLGDDPLVAEHSRRALGGAMATALDRREALHHQLLAVVDAASDVVVATRPSTDLREGAARPVSRWWDLIADRGGTGARHGHRTFPSGLHDALPPASEQEALLADLHALAQGRHPLGAHPSASADPALHQALTLLAARASDAFTAWDGNVEEVVAAGASLLPTGPVAVTALEAWATCPFAYFARFVLGVRPVDNPEEAVTMRAADRGVLVHDVLDSVIRDCVEAGDVPAPGSAWSERARALMEDELARHCAAAEGRGVVGQPLHWRLEQRRLARRLACFFELDAAARAAHGVRPVETEMPFGYEEEFALDLPDGRRVALRGQIDRVDAGPGRVVVVDYKTGKAKRVSEDDPFEGGTRLQLPIYGLAARERHGTASSAITAEYWYLHDETDEQARRPLDVVPATVERLVDVLQAITDGIDRGLFIPHPDPPDPFRPWHSCDFCDPDGLDTATLWGQWDRKRVDAGVQPYLDLVEPEPQP
jgi:RecB family exonuclease